ncbi:MAG: DUF2892 domain-containing protein [Anaerolineae bacterium]|nr:DUF2892 domain-containing protein [Anaerolineae bacterium]MDW8299267.1 DUF2892 domain-containing protein [Anaerolineae bacterium]
MKRNVGNVDRVIRLVLGIAAIAVGVAAGGSGPIIGGIVGAMLIGTALTGRCMAYVPFGINTCSAKERSQA